MSILNRCCLAYLLVNIAAYLFGYGDYRLAITACLGAALHCYAEARRKQDVASCAAE